MPPPGAQVHLVDVHGAFQDLPPAPRPAVGPVRPRKAVQVKDLAGVLRPGGGMGGVGVGPEYEGAVGPLDIEFILVVGLDAGDKPLPDAGGDGLHHGGLLVPAVEAAQHPHALGVGGPHAEDIALLSVHRLPVTAQEPVRVVADAAAEAGDGFAELVCFVQHIVPPNLRRIGAEPV